METPAPRPDDRTGPVTSPAEPSAEPPAAPPHRLRRFLCAVLRGLFWIIAVLMLLWAFGAIWFDGPFRTCRHNPELAFIWLAATVLLFARARQPRTRRLALIAGFLVVYIPWLFKSPSNGREWAPEYARIPYAKIEGDTLTVTNYRNFDYGLDGSVKERWETRVFHLSNLRGADFFLNYWGSPWIAHPITSFDFGPEGHMVFSVETRREKGETYTTLGGLYKLYELTYLAGDERDFIRLRANVRKDEDSYLYKLSFTPEQARHSLDDYLHALDQLHDKPRFYNVLTANCTTAIRNQTAAENRFPFDWRLLANGKLDQLLEERGMLAVKDLPLDELKRRGHVDDRSLPAHDDPDFSKRIREGVPGF